MTPTAQATPPTPQFLSAAESDPRVLGWMQGSPTPADKRIALADMGVYTFPKTRWSFAHFREFYPTRNIARAASPSALPLQPRDDLDAVRFTPMGGSQPMTWLQSLDANYTDAVVVLHRGRVVYETYRGVMHAAQPHACMSITKSYVGLLAAVAVHQDDLDETRLVTHYLPELAGSAWADATVRQVMDMTTGLQYDETYANPKAEIWEFARAGGCFPRPPGYMGAQSFYEFLQTVGKQGAHGEAFAYKTVNTDVLAWVLRRMTGHNLATHIAQTLWQPLGCEQEAYIQVDSAGTEFAGGGLSACLRDFARLGEMMRCEGAFNGRQIVPAAVVADIARGASPAHFAKSGFATLPGASYRNMWWVLHNDHNAFSARGIHGQAIYIDPKAEMVIARLGSHPIAANPVIDPTSLPAYHALALHLMA